MKKLIIITILLMYIFVGYAQLNKYAIKLQKENPEIINLIKLRSVDIYGTDTISVEYDINEQSEAYYEIKKYNLSNNEYNFYYNVYSEDFNNLVLTDWDMLLYYLKNHGKTQNKRY